MGLDDSLRSDATRSRRLFRRASGGKLDEPELRRAERIVQRLRWLAIGSWVWLIRGAETSIDPRITYGVYAATLVYAAVCEVQVRKGRRIGVIAVLTTVGDTFAIAAMCLVSGGLHSPIFPVFFLSVLATAIRFDIAEAFSIASLNTLHAVFLYAVVGSARPFELAEYVFYVYFVALLGGLLSSETHRQHRRAVEERERSALLLSLNRQVVAAADLSQMLPRMLAEVLRVIPARGVSAIVRQLGSDGVDQVAAAGELPPPSIDEAEVLLRSGESPGTGAAIGPTNLRGVASPWMESMRAGNVASAAIPGTPPLGVLLLAADGGGASLSESTASLLEATAEEIATAIQKARLQADLVDAQARSRELLRRMIDGDEAERRRIAGELHDRMGKRFFEFYYDVRLLQGMSVDRDSSSSEILARIIESARECAGEIRTLMNDLRPSVLDDFGFLEALKEFATALAGRGELELTLSIDEAAPSGGAEVDLMLFRVLQEAVFNARKHALAKRVEVEFGEFGEVGDRKLRLVVRDDGCGFDLDSRSPGHYGLLHMKERAEACGAEFEVRSVPRRGTEVEVRVPIAS